jgi:hypothetical protein
MKARTAAKPAPNGLPHHLKEIPVDFERAHLIDVQHLVAMRNHARLSGWKIKTRRADLSGQTFGVWRLS